MPMGGISGSMESAQNPDGSETDKPNELSLDSFVKYSLLSNRNYFENKLKNLTEIRQQN